MMVLAIISSVVLSQSQSQLGAYATISKNVVKGSLTSLQNDETGKATWIVSGVFRMDNMNSTSPTFNAALYNTCNFIQSIHTILTITRYLAESQLIYTNGTII